MRGTPKLGHKLGLVGLGLLLAIVLLEIGLRFGGWLWESPQSQRNVNAIQPAGGEDELVILFLGESTTGLGGPQSYPRLVEEIVRESGAQLIAVQYPMRDLAPLQKILSHDDTIVFVDNGPSFREAVERLGFWEVFSDQFAGDFGHMTLAGRRLLASNVARAVEPPQRKSIPANPGDPPKH